MATKYENGGTFRNLNNNILDALRCVDIVCSENCAFNSEGCCGVLVLHDILCKLSGADEFGDDTPQAYSDEKLIEFIRNNPAVKKEGEHT